MFLYQSDQIYQSDQRYTLFATIYFSYSKNTLLVKSIQNIIQIHLAIKTRHFAIQKYRPEETPYLDTSRSTTLTKWGNYIFVKILYSYFRLSDRKKYIEICVRDITFLTARPHSMSLFATFFVYSFPLPK